jgi:hypothetical protein
MLNAELLLNTSVTLLSTGNNSIRNLDELDDRNVKNAVVTKVAKVNMTIAITDDANRSYERVFRIGERRGRLHLHSKFNSGYLVFANKVEFEEYKRGEETRSFLKTNTNVLNTEQLNRIADVL